MLDSKTSNWPATKNNNFEGVVVPLKNKEEGKKETEPLPPTD
jgi:hypothetical protein